MTMTLSRFVARNHQPPHIAPMGATLSTLGRGLASSVWLLVAAAALWHTPALADGRSASHPEFPALRWRQLGKPEERGWSSQKLAVAKAYADSLDTAALMIIDDGVVVDRWGETSKRFNVHSIRKSFLSGLYGVAVARKEINLNATLDQLGIDDNEPSLTANAPVAQDAARRSSQSAEVVPGTGRSWPSLMGRSMADG
jgi:hypothetical protein